MPTATADTCLVDQVDLVYFVQPIFGTPIHFIRPTGIYCFGIRYQVLLARSIAQEIISIIAIWIARMRPALAVVRPSYRTACVEQDIIPRTEHAICTLMHIERHRWHIIPLVQCEFLAQHITAIAQHTHLLWLQSPLLQFIVCDGVNTRFFDSYFHHIALTQNRLLRITMTLCHSHYGQEHRRQYE